MNFEPQKFFIGLMDFFAVLLPGALLTWLLPASLRAAFLGAGPLTDTQLWSVFFFCSYLLGHFVFLLGSWLDEAYDRARRATRNRTIASLARGGPLRPRWQRSMLALVFKKEMDLAVRCAERLKQRELAPVQGSRAVNAFQWAKLRLAAEQPEALAFVQRFEADSKFFRSLIVVLLLLPLLASPAQFLVFCVASALLLPLAFWRYMEQRHKATNQAYWAVITLEGRRLRAIAADEPPAAPGTAPTHAGGVVYWPTSGGAADYLLVEATADLDDWVLPKGHIEPGEDARQTAVREVREETGVWARVEAELPTLAFALAGQPEVRARMYLMRGLERGRPDDRLRQHAWLRLPDAAVRVHHDELRALLGEAERIRLTLRR